MSAEIIRVRVCLCVTKGCFQFWSWTQRKKKIISTSRTWWDSRLSNYFEMQWWALAEVATFKGEWIEVRSFILYRRYVSQNTISGLNAQTRSIYNNDDRLHKEQWTIWLNFRVRICDVYGQNMKREQKIIIRKSLNNDDEIELSFRFNENWIKIQFIEFMVC